MKPSAITRIILYPFILTLLLSCEKGSEPLDNTLGQALDLVESNPAKALEIVNNIDGYEIISEAERMQYIVARVYIKHEAKQNIKNDTLIYTAQEYFNKNTDKRLTPLANFCAAWVYYHNNQNKHSFQSYLQAKNEAILASDYKLTGRCLNNIGYMYYLQNIMDSSIVNFQQALDYYQKAENCEKYILQTTYSLGSAYFVKDNYDLALAAYNDGLALAKKINNKEYQAIFKYHKATVYTNLKEYDKALALFHEALGQKLQAEDSLRIYLNLSLLHKSCNQLDSFNYYRNLLELRTFEINNKQMLKRIYTSSMDYYTDIKKYEEALKYSRLKEDVNIRIQSESKVREIYEANAEYRQTLQQKEKDFNEARKQFIQIIIILVAIIALIVGLILIFIYKVRQQHKKEEEALQMQIMLCEKSRARLSLNNPYYKDITLFLLSCTRDAAPKIADNSAAKEDSLIKSGNKDEQECLRWAVRFFENYPSGEGLISPLTDDYQVILFAMCCKNFTYDEKAQALHKSVHEIECIQKELEQALLKDGFLSQDQVDSLLYNYDLIC